MTAAISSVIVTGGFGALGRTVAAAFAAQGWRVARLDRQDAPTEGSGGMLDLGGVDLADPQAAAAAVARVEQAFGTLDALVNIAGGFTWETITDGSPASWEHMYRINVLTALSMTRAALPLLRRSDAGRIVNIGAGAALKSEAGMGAYAAAKSSVHRLTESLAAELRGETVTVNAILPSIIDTPANRADMPDTDFSSWVKPEAIADAVLFLVSPAARAISGALIPVNRGSAS
ncbi:MAG: SDR family NAD(P)-dependent oxidoreductase [Alphaproteobacteria bacterium]|nr:SDR family NAD(P)-dependent oxidoreductase [Alphaproteobacteria bacterium]